MPFLYPPNVMGILQPFWGANYNLFNKLLSVSGPHLTDSSNFFFLPIICSKTCEFIENPAIFFHFQFSSCLQSCSWFFLPFWSPLAQHHWALFLGLWFRIAGSSGFNFDNDSSRTVKTKAQDCQCQLGFLRFHPISFER